VAKSVSRGAPRGRENVIAALVSSATTLFAERGPDGVPLREVAAHAGVNYGLIAQYIGTKEDLIRLVVRSVSESVADVVKDAPTREDALQQLLMIDRHSTYIRMLAWALLEGREAATLLGTSPAQTSLLQQLEDDTEEVRILLAAVTSMILGWHVFGDFLLAGVGLTDQGERVAATIRDLSLDTMRKAVAAQDEKPQAKRGSK